MKTWREFTKGKMGHYMKSEGSHGAAMTRLSKEWKEYQAEHGTTKLKKKATPSKAVSKTHTKTHKSEKAARVHESKIKARGGKVITSKTAKGITLKYSF